MIKRSYRRLCVPLNLVEMHKKDNNDTVGNPLWLNAINTDIYDLWYTNTPSFNLFLTFFNERHDLDGSKTLVNLLTT